MKQRNTHPFSVSPHNAEKANGFAAQIPEALLLLAGFMALGAGLAATWSGYGWLCLLVGAAAACWQCAARQLWRGWAGVALPLLILLAAAILSRSVVAGCVSVCRTICTRWTEMTGRITLPPGRGGRKSAAFCLSDGGTVRGALRGGCSPFTDGLRHCADRFFERAAVAASTGAGRELDGTLSVRGTVPADWKHPTECDRVFVKGRLTSRSWAACSSASGSSGNAQRERVFRVAGGERGCAAPAAL